MTIEVVEDKKNKFVFKSDDFGHTYLNAIKGELWNDSHVKVATYALRHPIVSRPKFIVETDGSDARDALKDAANRLKKSADKLKKDAAKELK